jgi:hypothetical protein
MAPLRRTVRCISNENADGERNRRSSVRVVLHEFFQEIVALNGNVPDLLSTILGDIHGLAVCVLGGSRGIPSSSTYAADVANATRDAIIVHRTSSRFDVM